LQELPPLEEPLPEHEQLTLFHEPPAPRHWSRAVVLQVPPLEELLLLNAPELLLIEEDDDVLELLSQKQVVAFQSFPAPTQASRAVSSHPAGA
jgi:hypothetical protein